MKIAGDSENVRRGGFEALRDALPADVSRRPDIGGPTLHPTAGACAVGVRKFLIAYNVELATEDLSIAREVAEHVRESSGGLPAVKALGLALAGRNRTQVSMNLTDFERTPPHVVFDTIRAEAQRMGAEVAGSELIGLIPRRALEGAPSDFRAMFRRDQILENRLEEVGLGGRRRASALLSPRPLIVSRGPGGLTCGLGMAVRAVCPLCRRGVENTEIPG